MRYTAVAEAPWGRWKKGRDEGGRPLLLVSHRRAIRRCTRGGSSEVRMLYSCSGQAYVYAGQHAASMGTYRRIPGSPA